jgi:tape measure domain-containing protein
MGISGGALRAGRAVIELGLVGQAGIETALNNLKGRVQTIGQSINKIGTTGGGGFSGLTNLLAGGAATTALAWPVKLAANMEVLEAQLSVFTGSKAAAHDMLMELQKFSGVSMVPADRLVESAAMMLRYGQSSKQAVANTKALAAIAAGSADEFDKLTLAFAQVGSAGRLQGEEMRQFKNTAFNPLREIANRTGESMLAVKKRMEAGGVSFAEVSNALQSSVGPAGRFNGILEAISNTLTGQMQKAWAQFKLAVLPLGNELLAPLTKFFRAINGLIPAMAGFIEQHAATANVILASAAAVGVAAIAFTSMRVGVALLSTVVSSVVGTFGVFISLLGFVLSPIGAVAIALAGLTAWFVTSTEAGHMMTTSIAGWFTALAKTAQDSFQGIANALQAGDIQLSADVMFAGLKLAWLQGTNDLEKIWTDFKNVGVKTIIEMLFEINKQWVDNISFMRTQWVNLIAGTQVLGEIMGHAFSASNDPDTAREQATATRDRINAIMGDARMQQQAIKNERQAQLNTIDKVQGEAQAFQDQRHGEELDAAKSELEAARNKLGALTDKARAEAEGMPDAKKWFGAANFMQDVGAGLDKAMQTLKPQALFDTRLAQQTFGGGTDNIPAQQLETQRKILVVLDKAPGGLAFV